MKMNKKLLASVAVLGGLLLSVVAVAPAQAATTPLNGGITGNGTVYHSTPRYNAAGALSLTGISMSAGCGGRSDIAIRNQVAASVPSSNRIQMYATSGAFTIAATGSQYWGAGNKFFMSTASGSMETCNSDWWATYHTP